MNTEEKRNHLQQFLDSQKSQEERNVMGQFSTPFPLAMDIVSYALSLSANHRILPMLEPACGLGVFFSAMQQATGSDSLQGSIGFEVDAHYSSPSAELWKEYGVDIRRTDFLSEKPFRQFPLIIANPPYSRHHHIPTAEKKVLQEAVLKETGIKPSGLSGLYCYFLMLSTRWLQDGGLSCWLIPSEFMDVNYGEAVKQYLLEKVDMISIHRFDEKDLQFSDALVTSSIVVFRNSKPSDRPIVFSYGGSVNHPSYSSNIGRRQLDYHKKWNQYFDHNTHNAEKPRQQRVLGDFFEVKRGIATGCNRFFIVNDDIIARYNLPSEYLTPVLPAPRKMKDDIVESVDGIPVVDEKFFLFSSSDSIEVIAAKHSGVLDYIKKGEEEKINQSYICSRHTPWYRCEKRESAPFVIPYMGRSTNGRKMFRFILNRSDAIATNGYLLIYPKPKYAYLFRNPAFATSVWKCLNDISAEEIEKSGRVYGGGLHKLEPRELLSLPVAGLDSLFGDSLLWVA